MMVEIPDPEVLLGGLVAFVAGVFGLFFYHKAKSYVNSKQNEANPAHLKRLEYYEKMLIDMKIRLDALDVASAAPEPGATQDEPKKIMQRLATERDAPNPAPARRHKAPDPAYSDVTVHVLHLITGGSMTSRDIQEAIGRTREHTSRLMKKLSEDGLVQRHVDTKPFKYSITAKGMERLGPAEYAPISA